MASHDSTSRTFAHEGLAESSIAVLGIPWDEKSSYLRGAAAGPAHIRQALHSSSSNTATESGLDFRDEQRIRVLADLDLEAGDVAFETIERHIDGVLGAGSRVVCLGGDHSVTLAYRPRSLSTFSPASPSCTSMRTRICTMSSTGIACPMPALSVGSWRRASLPGWCSWASERSNEHQRQQADRFGVEVLEMSRWRPEDGLPDDLEGPLYLSLDLDALDPAFAPGVSHPEPGGLSTRELLDILQTLPSPLVGADIVELNPLRDVHDLTARVAAKMLKEIAARMLQDFPT